MNKVVFSVLLSCLFSGVFAQNALDFAGGTTSGCLVNTNQPAIAGNAARTIEAWVRAPSSFLTIQRVIADMGDMVTGGRFTLNIANGQVLRIEIDGNGISGTTDITDNNWHHVAVSYNPANPAGQKAKLYVDGMLETQGDFTVPMNTVANAATIRVGCRVDGNRYFNGTIDEVRIWNIERSATEIANNRNNSFCNIPPGLICYFKFDEGIAGGNNISITSVANSANPSYPGLLYSFTKTGSTSNFVTGIVPTNATSSTITPVTCSSYTSPSGKYVYTSSGIYRDTIANSAGCDSTITIQLNIAGNVPVANLTTSNLTASSVLITWLPVPAVAGYEYALTTSAAPRYRDSDQ